LGKIFLISSNTNTGGLFGNNQNKPLFGQSQQNTGIFGQPSTTGPSNGGVGSLGSGSIQTNSGTQNATAGTSSNLFTTNQVNNPPASTTGPGLFGAPATTNGGLLGANSGSNPLFGASTTVTNPSAAGFQNSTLFGQQPGLQNQNVHNTPNLNLQSKYSELPETFQKELDTIESDSLT
jgi:hypothetical protein